MTAASLTFKNMEWPSLRDPRWIVLTFLMSFMVYATVSPHFSRQFSQFAVALIGSVGLEMLIMVYYHRKWMFPLSAIITSFGIYFICDSPTIWVYFVTALVSIACKNFMRINGKHIFNPNNLGVVMMTLLFPTYVTTIAGRWGGNLYLSILIACLGTFLVYRAQRLILTLTFVGTFIAGAFARSAITGGKIEIILGPMFGPGFQLFIFYMITDPQTTPKSWKQQISFGVVLGIIDAYYRYLNFHQAPFYALFTICPLYYIIANHKEIIATLREPSQAA